MLKKPGIGKTFYHKSKGIIQKPNCVELYRTKMLKNIFVVTGMKRTVSIGGALYRRDQVEK